MTHQAEPALHKAIMGGTSHPAPLPPGSRRRSVRLLALGLIAAALLGLATARSRSAADKGIAGLRAQHVIPWCVPTELRILGDSQGENTTHIGDVTFQARTGVTCRLQGQPLVALYGTGRRLRVRQEPFARLAPLSRRDTLARTVIVRPGHAAEFIFDWINYCGPAANVPSVLTVTLPHQSRRAVVSPQRPHLGVVGPPVCLAASQPSTLWVGVLRALTPLNPLA